MIFEASGSKTIFILGSIVKSINQKGSRASEHLLKGPDYLQQLNLSYKQHKKLITRGKKPLHMKIHEKKIAFF